MRARPAATAAALSRPLARGAQVRNLSSCVKVALDFVSPENARRCVTLTNQFAKLPRGHHLSEDKLQVKTMLLHAMEHIAGALLPQHGASAGPSGRADVEAAEAAARALGEALSRSGAEGLQGGINTTLQTLVLHKAKLPVQALTGCAGATSLDLSEPKVEHLSLIHI